MEKSIVTLATYQIGASPNSSLDSVKAKYTPSFDLKGINKKYIEHIENLINIGRLDKAKTLTMRSDRFPKDYTIYLKKFSASDFQKFFPHLKGKARQTNLSNFMIK